MIYMKKAVTLLVLLSLFLPLHAQKTKVQGTVTIKAREDLLKELPAEAAYFMPEFRDATVQFNDGKLSQGRINICLVDNSVRFIEESGDTLLLSNAENVMRILIGDTVMLQREGYFIKQLTAYGQKFLGERRILTLEEPDIDAGYSSIPAVSTAKRGNMIHVDPNRQMASEKEMEYSLSIKYFVGDDTVLYPARLSSFVKLFPEKKKDVRSWSREQGTDFNDKISLIDLFYYCTE